MNSTSLTVLVRHDRLSRFNVQLLNLRQKAEMRFEAHDETSKIR